MIADGLSRQRCLHTEWTLHPRIFAAIANLPISRRDSSRRGRFSLRHHREKRLCVPANVTGTVAAGTDGHYTVQRDSGGPSSVETILDNNTPQTVCSTPTETATQSRPVDPTVLRTESPTSRNPEPPCISAIKSRLREKGYAESVINRICHSRRGSTLEVYSGKWTVFQSWCDQQGCSSLDLPPERLCDFFEHLFVTVGLQPVTIKGYRSAIARVYRLCGFYDCGKHELISALMANFDIQRPRTATLFPKWSLDIVLEYLQSSLFQPIETIGLIFLTYKTVFLVALASAFRVSELHALSVSDDCCRFNADGSCSLLTCLGFVAKNRLPSDGPQRLLLKPLNELPSLCPVRTLRVYIDRTKSIRRSNHQLIVSACKPRQKTTPQLLSTYICSTVRQAYDWKAARSGNPSQEATTSTESHTQSCEDQDESASGWDRLLVGAGGHSPSLPGRLTSGPLPAAPLINTRGRVWAKNPPPADLHRRRDMAGHSPRRRTHGVPADDQGQPFQGRAAHELRALATSLALHRGTPLRDILRAVGWSAESTFARHYLRHVPAVSGQMEVAVRLPTSGE